MNEPGSDHEPTLAVPRRRGRPPRQISADTPRRILDTARRLFADKGYAATTNRMVAAEAGITPTALYHYHPSKLELYGAVYADTTTRFSAALRHSMESGVPFIRQVTMLLGGSRLWMHRDESMSRFLESARVDVTRYPELGSVLGALDDWWFGQLDEMVQRAVGSGEVASDGRDEITGFIVAVLIGLNQVALINPDLHGPALAAATTMLAQRLGAQNPAVAVGGTDRER